jgi:hypothetical protein
MRFFRDRLHDIELAAVHMRVLKLMENTRPGTDPSPEELHRIIRDS